MVKEELADLGIKSVLKMLHSNPEKAIPRLLKIINMVGKKLFPSQLKIINEYMSCVRSTRSTQTSSTTS